MESIVIADRYELGEVIGQGGEARVYRARDKAHNITVAVRVALHPRTQMAHDTPTPYHPGWVRLIASGNDTRIGAYQVLELLEGRTLAQMMAAEPLDAHQWREFVSASLAAVSALHSAFWVHGDLNADNFFLADGGWKLLELPFLRFDAPQSRTAAFGSIYTLAPEQIDGAPADARSDLYALGCLYYHAASGAWPHPGATAQEVAIHCLRFPPEPLAEKAPNLPASWSNWVMTLLPRRPEARPAPDLVRPPF